MDKNKRDYFLVFLRTLQYIPEIPHTYLVVVANILSHFPVLHVPVGNRDPQQEFPTMHWAQ